VGVWTVRGVGWPPGCLLPAHRQREREREKPARWSLLLVKVTFAAHMLKCSTQTCSSTTANRHHLCGSGSGGGGGGGGNGASSSPSPSRSRSRLQRALARGDEEDSCRLKLQRQL
jgi:hypothetical protein